MIGPKNIPGVPGANTESLVPFRPRVCLCITDIHTYVCRNHHIDYTIRGKTEHQGCLKGDSLW